MGEVKQGVSDCRRCLQLHKKKNVISTDILMKTRSLVTKTMLENTLVENAV